MPVRKVLTAPNQKLHLKSRRLTPSEIGSTKIKTIISDIYDTLRAGEYGVGMSAIQIGEPIAACVVMIRPTPNRTNLEHFDRVYFNPEIIKTFGTKVPMWEGCCSVLDDNGDPVYAEVPRYRKIKVKYYDESSCEHIEIVDGFLAHVLQHEIDHINGTIFTDIVPLLNTISLEEYRKIVTTKKAL